MSVINPNPQSHKAKARNANIDDVSPEHFLSRESTWLEFNRRVLHEALDTRTPLLERVKFLAIFTSNLDEYVMKRVGAMKRQVAAGVAKRTSDGRTPAETLALIRSMILPMLEAQGRVFNQEIHPALARHGIHLLEYDQLTQAERHIADEYFNNNVFPVLTPLAVDPGHPFPFISNLSTSLGVTLNYPNSAEKVFARIKVPEVLPQWVRIESHENTGEMRYVALADLIRHNLDDLFPEMKVIDVMPFRLTRNADVERDEEDAEDLLEMIEQELRQRRFEKAVRLEHGPNPDPWMRAFLIEELGLTEADVYEIPGPLDYTHLFQIASIDIPEISIDPWKPTIHPALADEETDIFSIIRQGDVLLHHPYESFSGSVQRLIQDAAADPNVLAIKMTLYRTGDDSPFIHTLIRAAEAGKQVVCLVELKARFDEERNVQLAQKLEKAGVHVVYGLVGFKTHTKTAMVVRKDTDAIRTYCHIGTGNYHAGTAKLYTDYGLLTCDPELSDDVAQIFNYLTGRSMKSEYNKMLVAPVNMRDRYLEMIDEEIANHRAGKPAHIVAKMNQLEHRGICRKLYEASQAGVPVDLIVRGFCCLRPGVPGLSDNIRVISVIGRFLEHSRIFYFRSAAENPVDGRFFIGSADWMYRNLMARVEATTPVEHDAGRQELWDTMQIMLADRRQAWEMQPDGRYIQRKPEPNSNAPEDLGTQQVLMNQYRKAIHNAGE